MEKLDKSFASWCQLAFQTFSLNVSEKAMANQNVFPKNEHQMFCSNMFAFDTASFILIILAN